VLLVRAVSTEHFYRIVYVLMLTIGLKLCWDGFSGFQ
jgi:uncharacterized membrane protein YfcA